MYGWTIWRIDTVNAPETAGDTVVHIVCTANALSGAQKQTQAQHLFETTVVCCKYNHSLAGIVCA